MSKIAEMPSETDLIGKIIRLSPTPAKSGDKPISGALLRCFPCMKQAPHGTLGTIAIMVAGTSEHPIRTKCADCGRHMGWFGRHSFPGLAERVIA